MVLQFVGNAFIIWAFALALAAFGAALASYLARPILKPPTRLFFSLCYFLGISVFLGLWRVLAIFLQSPKIAFMTSLVILSSTLYLQRDALKKSISFPKIKWTQLGFSAAWILFSHVFCALFWTRDFYDNPWSTMGSGHSPRYANIALYILDSDRFPIVGQNYGQSLLALIPSYLSPLRTPLVALDIWLGLSIGVLGILTYSFFRWMKVSPGASLGGSILTLFGNATLARKHVMILDTGSPFVVNAYTDTLCSLGTFIAFFYILLQPAQTESDGQGSAQTSAIKKWIYALFIFCLGISWTMSAPQNLIVTGIILGLIIVSGWIRPLFLTSGSPKPNPLKKLKSPLPLIVTLGLLISATVAGVFTGGMFTPKTFRDNSKIPGMQTVSQNGGPAVRFVPQIPFFVGSYTGWEAGWLQPGWKIDLPEDAPLLKQVGARLFQSWILIFYPLMGVLCLLGCSWKKKLKGPKELQKVAQAIGIISALALGVGVLFSFPISIFSYKWELSRFTLVGFYLGFTCLILGIHYWTLNVSKKLRTRLLFVVVIAASWGPIGSIGKVVRRELKNFPVFVQKYRALAEYREIRS